jgi:hypothetical protein
MIEDTDAAHQETAPAEQSFMTEGDQEEFVEGEGGEMMGEEGEEEDLNNIEGSGRKRKRSFQKFVYLSLEDRYNIILELQKDLAHRRSHAKIAQQYGVTRQCISKLAKHKDAILYNYLSGMKKDTKLMKPVPAQKDPNVIAAMEEIKQLHSNPPEPQYAFDVNSLPTWDDIQYQLTNILNFLKYKQFAEEEMLLDHVVRRIAGKIIEEAGEDPYHLGHDGEGGMIEAGEGEGENGLVDPLTHLSSEAAAIAVGAAQQDDDDSENEDKQPAAPVVATDAAVLAATAMIITTSPTTKPKKGRPRKKSLKNSEEPVE